ncbi:MAG: hypothetical protein OXT09_18340 [Myxococcales bacterium]|nr:hypothetical protein [Myxococcales bacterium]
MSQRAKDAPTEQPEPGAAPAPARDAIESLGRDLIRRAAGKATRPAFPQVPQDGKGRPPET